MLYIYDFLTFQDRIEGEQTFTVIRSGSGKQIQNGDIVVGDIMMVSCISIFTVGSIPSYS